METPRTEDETSTSQVAVPVYAPIATLLGCHARHVLLPGLPRETMQPSGMPLITVHSARGSMHHGAVLGRCLQKRCPRHLLERPTKQRERNAIGRTHEPASKVSPVSRRSLSLARSRPLSCFFSACVCVSLSLSLPRSLSASLPPPLFSSLLPPVGAPLSIPLFLLRREHSSVPEMLGSTAHSMGCSNVTFSSWAHPPSESTASSVLR